ncbi:MAG: hypothetical protein RI575_17850 [Balneolaceae bacterium]|nr:hypothetical protein [Balneolaceae bacterium]
MLNTPVLFIVYNRMETTKQVFAKIKEVKPSKIYIAADGPKRPEDQKKVDQVRKYILENIDWPTEIRTLFQEKNLGVQRAVNESLQWFFSFEERGIILEDDCLPTAGFFKYCEELLELYRNDTTIGIITGRNELGVYETNQTGDYFLSTRGFVWGWATWRDRIKNLDISIFEKIKIKEMADLFRNTSSILEFVYRLKNVQELKNNRVDTWDYQWSICLLLNAQFTLVPKKNMVQNIGLGNVSTHKFELDIDDVEVFENLGEINHPDKLTVEKTYTWKTVKKHTGGLLKVLIPRFLVKTVRYFK